MNPEIEVYNKKQAKSDQEICDLLATEIMKSMPKAENKIWHRNPVWFIDGNPVVGYDKLKDSVRLLFWSGKTFKEKDLKNEGSFKAAEIRYTEVGQIKKTDVRRWLKLAKEIQWDYKNIVKRKGKLVRIKVK